MAEMTLDVGRLVHRAVTRELRSRGPLFDVLAQVVDERRRQDGKWGEQNHPDVGPVVDGWSPASVAAFYGVPTAYRAKQATDTAAELGTVSWAHIAIEELAEAVEAAASGDEDALRTEVVQAAAVLVAWAQALDRRRAARAGQAVTDPDVDQAVPREQDAHPHEDVLRVRELLDGEGS